MGKLMLLVLKTTLELLRLISNHKSINLFSLTATALFCWLLGDLSILAVLLDILLLLRVTLSPIKLWLKFLCGKKIINLVFMFFQRSWTKKSPVFIWKNLALI